MASYIVVNLTMELVCLLVAGALLAGLLLARAYKDKLAGIIVWMLVVNCAMLLSDLFAWWFAARPEPWVRPILLAANFTTYTVSYLFPVLISHYILTYIAYRRPDVPRWPLRAMAGANAVMMLLSAASLFTGWVYSIDGGNRFVPGPLYPFAMGFIMLALLANVGLVLANRKSLEKRDTGILLLFLLTLCAATVVEALFVAYMLVYLAATMAIVVLYVSIQVRQERWAAERENAMKTAVMLSQIQPHFLFNSLLAIKALCRPSPARAEAAIDDFSRYLRGNMESLTQTGAIPFERELRHTAAYLALEQERFQDRLQVALEVNCTGFSIPPLTLQPIVENAIRHGLMAREAGGTLTIRTEERPDCWQVTVRDDGVGFTPSGTAPAEAGRHIGIGNVRQRLAAISGGTLSFQSGPGEGTTATITLPKAGGPSGRAL